MNHRTLAKQHWACGLLGLGVLVVAQVAFAAGECTEEEMEKMRQGGIKLSRMVEICGQKGGPTGPQTPVDIRTGLIGAWRCLASSPPGSKVEAHYAANGKFDHYYTTGVAPAVHIWGTYTVQSLGGNRGALTMTPQGSSAGGVGPSETTLFTMVNQNATEDQAGVKCERIQ
jgi:hypothetical protein